LEQEQLRKQEMLVIIGAVAVVVQVLLAAMAVKAL
jgi:hypothetical protein